MKSLKRMTILGVAGLLVVATLFSPLANAQTDLSDEEKQRIQTSCQSIKATMNQLHVTDALLRVNRGQLYEAIASKLMDRFNNRLASNSIDTDKFTSITENYRQVLVKFRSDYVNYEQQLSKAMVIDCTANPQEFNEAVESARSLRKKVHADITALNSAIVNYQSTVDDFLKTYQEATNGIGQ